MCRDLSRQFAHEAKSQRGNELCVFESPKGLLAYSPQKRMPVIAPNHTLAIAPAGFAGPLARTCRWSPYLRAVILADIL